MYLGEILTLEIEGGPTSLNPDSVWKKNIKSENLKRGVLITQSCLSVFTEILQPLYLLLLFAVCSSILRFAWPSVAAAVWEMRQFEGESPKRSYKMVMMTMMMSMWVCTNVEKGGVRLRRTGREGEGEEKVGESSTTSLASTFIYLERPPTVGEGSWCNKNLKMVYFAASSLGLASLKKVNLAGFGHS